MLVIFVIQFGGKAVKISCLAYRQCATLRHMPRKRNLDFPLKSKIPTNRRSVSLKELAAHLNLSTTSLSLVLNNSPIANTIPQETKDRIHAAAKEFNYRPNYLARSLRAQRTHTLGVLVPELSDGYSAMVLSGVEDYLIQAGYFYILACHRHRDNLIEHYPKVFADRCVEGIIAVDTPYSSQIDLPVITVSGHEDIPGITNIVLNHQRAASLALDHLMNLGHKRIAFIKGQDFSSDTEVRWQAICEAALIHNLEIDADLVAQLEGDKPSPELGYIATQKLLARNKNFTAVFTFNDISAIGAIRALNEKGLSVPDDVSVLGFDDVYVAAFHNPALTTIRQPLFEMGRLAAKTVLQRIADGYEKDFPEILTVEPELVIRQSTSKTTT